MNILFTVRNGMTALLSGSTRNRQTAAAQAILVFATIYFGTVTNCNIHKALR